MYIYIYNITVSKWSRCQHEPMQQDTEFKLSLSLQSAGGFHSRSHWPVPNALNARNRLQYCCYIPQQMPGLLAWRRVWENDPKEGGGGDELKGTKISCTKTTKE